MRRSCRIAMIIPIAVITKPNTPKLSVVLNGSEVSWLTIALFVEDATSVFETLIFNVGVAIDVVAFAASIADADVLG